MHLNCVCIHLFTCSCFLVDLVRTRSFVKKFILMRANIQAVSLKIQTLRSQAAMANAMKGWYTSTVFGLIVYLGMY